MSVPAVLRHWLAIFATLFAVLLALWCMQVLVDVAYALIDTLRFLLTLRSVI